MTTRQDTGAEPVTTSEAERGAVGVAAPLRVFTNHTDTVVAVDLADAQRVVEQQYGATFEQEGWTLDEWGEVPGGESITIRNVHGEGWDDVETRTAAEWAALSGRCFLCSTEW